MMSQGQERHAQRDPQSGIIRKDVKILHVRVLNDSIQQDQLEKIGKDLTDALKATGRDQEYIVAVTPPGIMIEVDWTQAFLKRLETNSNMLKDAEFLDQLRKLLEQGRQKRWSNQNPPPGTMFPP